MDFLSDLILGQTVTVDERYIRVVHSIHDLRLPARGQTVAQIREDHRQRLNLPYFAEAYVNGEPVPAEHCLAGSDCLEFVQPFGWKGGKGRPGEELKAEGLLASYPGLIALAEEVKAMNLDTGLAIDVLAEKVARFIENKFGPVPQQERPTLVEVVRRLDALEKLNRPSAPPTTAWESMAHSIARIADRLDPSPPEIVDSTYVAGRLGCTTTWIADLARSGEIPKSCIVAGTGNGKPWKFHRTRIDEWIGAR